jgi:hypothetical protein
MGTFQAAHRDMPNARGLARAGESLAVVGASLAVPARPAGPARDEYRPDERPPRGNPPLELADLERGEEKLHRVLGW